MNTPEALKKHQPKFQIVKDILDTMSMPFQVVSAKGVKLRSQSAGPKRWNTEEVWVTGLGRHPAGVKILKYPEEVRNALDALPLSTLKCLWVAPVNLETS
jgi:hypothetical protein